jgi:hypothetical protein
LIVIFTGRPSKVDDFVIIAVVGSRTHPPIIMRFAVFLQTATKKTANGGRYAMLKVIQHGVMIAKY